MIRHRVAVLISGRGSNMTSLIEVSREPDYPATIALVVSNRPAAAGLERAHIAGVEALAIDHEIHSTRESFEQALDTALRERAIEIVCLAGFMRRLTPWFVERWAGRMLNIHPSLLPLFRGIHTHERALAAGVLVHGCTVHYVVPELDAGPILAQAAVPVIPGDTPETLAARVLAQEHVIYPRAVQMVCSGEARLDGSRVVFTARWDGGAALRSPDEASLLLED
jgi:phosphoribosylglycinamide formyltransferase-1